MIRLSIRTRVVAWFLALAALLLAIFSFSLFFDARRSAYRAMDELLLSRASGYGSMVEYDQGRFEFEAGDAAFFQPRSGEPWRGFAIYRAPNRKAIFVSPSLSRAASLPATLALALPAGEQGPVAVSRRLDGGNALIRIHAGIYPTRTDPDTTGVRSSRQNQGPAVLVVTAEDLAPLKARLRRLTWRILAAFPVTLLVAAVFGWLLSARIIAPISSIAESAARIEAGDLSGRVPVRGSGDEIDRLASTLNDAFGRLSFALESQSRFTADAAHEVRTPVAVVRAQAESTLRAERTSEEYHRALTRILESALRLEELVEGLLVLSRADSRRTLDHPESVDLSLLARRVVDTRAEDADRRSLPVDLRVPGPVMVRGDRRLIEIAAGNLLDNAIRFSVELGRIAVTVESQEGVVLLHVSDQGPGIEKEHLPHIFERFYTANASRSRDEGGAGLGLSLVEAIARLHGGTVTVRSGPREGSVFSLRLPLHPAS